MVKDAEAHAAEDSKRREQAEARNQADTLVYQTEKLLREQGESFSGDEKKAVEDGVADLKKALEGDDADAIRAATDKLASSSQAFGQKLYEAAASQAGTGAGAGSGSTSDGADDEVVDAEIVDDEAS